MFVSNLILVRGLPGSGKSTVAAKIAQMGYFHVETDQFFMENGQYVFRPEMLKTYHKFCQEKTKDLLKLNKNVVVSNTFSQIWEMKPYLEMCWELQIPYEVYICNKNFGSIHDVPIAAIKRMRERWEVFPNEKTIFQG